MSSLYGATNDRLAAGSDARTNVIYAIDRLKEKFPASIPSQELISYVLPHPKRHDEQAVKLFKTLLGVNPKISFDPATENYRFKPEYDISSPDDLLRFLQCQDSSKGIHVRDLKEGWPDVQEAINVLDKEHKLLVTRNKKDSQPRMVWANDPTLFVPLDQEFKEIFNQIPLPSVEDTITALTKMNYKTTGAPASKEVTKVEKKKKKVRRGVKVTNVHMQGLFRDYSNQRPQGTK